MPSVRHPITGTRWARCGHARPARTSRRKPGAYDFVEGKESTPPQICRIVQHGTQNRSSRTLSKAQKLRDGGSERSTWRGIAFGGAANIGIIEGEATPPGLIGTSGVAAPAALLKVIHKFCTSTGGGMRYRQPGRSEPRRALGAGLHPRKSIHGRRVHPQGFRAGADCRQ